MIKITCNCRESFRISEENMITKESIVCPNCGQVMDEKVLNSLISYAKSKIESDSYFEKAGELSVNIPQEGEKGWGHTDWELSIES